ncbi:MAG: glycosyltransferase family 4 protein [Acidobacteriota bacterium]|nr:glycosyltransferase family 4 protein [Acidobacteriota bacterium]
MKARLPGKGTRASRPYTAKILYFTDNRGYGGTENMLLTIMAGLDRSQWEPVLVHRSASGFEDLDYGARSLGVRVWAVSEMNGKRDINWVVPFVKKLRSEKPDVFHAHWTTPNQSGYAVLAAVVAQIPAVIVTQHHLYPEQVPLLRRLHGISLTAGVDRFIAVSNDVARNLRSLCLLPSRIRVVHNGIDLRPFGRPADSSLREFLNKGTGRPIVLCVARLDRKQKGLRFLVEAASLVPEAQFVLAGEGPERSALEAQARDLGVDERVTLLGFFEDLPNLLASCDLFVLPSLCEGFGLTAAEAMACSKPVVASNIGGLNEVVVHGETGLLVPPGDSCELAAGIRTMLSNSVLAARMGIAGQERVHREFSAERMVQRTTDIYEEILARADGAAAAFHDDSERPRDPA